MRYFKGGVIKEYIQTQEDMYYFEGFRLVLIETNNGNLYVVLQKKKDSDSYIDCIGYRTEKDNITARDCFGIMNKMLKGYYEN